MFMHQEPLFVQIPFNPLSLGGGAVRPPAFFCPLLKISLRNPYLKILDLAKLFVSDAPMKFFF